MGTPLPYASIRIENSAIATMSDGEGRFMLKLEQGEYPMLFSYIGHRSERLLLHLIENTTVNVKLLISEIQMSEVVVNSDDPAVAIMLEVINKKIKNQNRLLQYQAKTYSKDTFGGDSSLSLISESYSTLYFKKNDSLREVVSHRRQSSNLNKEFHLSAVRDFLNFYSDTLSQWGYSFLSPLASNAFDWYEFKLSKTFQEEGKIFHAIIANPKSGISPLFTATLIVSDSSHLVHTITATPNNVFQLPVFDIKQFTIYQQYNLYDDTFWMPLGYHVVANMEFRLYGLPGKALPLQYKKSVISYEYRINHDFIDSISFLPKLSLLESVDNADTSLWSDVVVFPLSQTEEKSYQIIDSVLNAQSPWVKTLLNIQNYKSTLDMVDLKYNRVEGLFLGGNKQFFINKEKQRAEVRLGIGLADNVPKYSVSIGSTIFELKYFWLDFEVYHRIITSPINYSMNEFGNSIAVFFDGQDYWNYFYSKGGRASLSWEGFDRSILKLSVQKEKHFSAVKNTDLSINSLLESNEMRNNPGIHEGNMVSAILEWNTKEEILSPFFGKPRSKWRFRFEHATKNLGSSFSFTSIYGFASFRLHSFGEKRLYDPYLGISLTLGTTWGEAPLQRLFAFESPLLDYTFAGAFRTIKNIELLGDQIAAATIEHNFRDIPFIVIGAPKVHLDLIVGVSHGKLNINTMGLKGKISSIQQGYSEAFIGLGRVFDYLRIDISYSPYNSGRTNITFAGAI